MGSGCAWTIVHLPSRTVLFLILRPGGLATGNMELKLRLHSFHVLFSASTTVVLHLRLLTRFDEDPAVIYHT